MDTEVTSQFPSTLRRLLLILISLIVSVIMGSALISSWKEPQVASRLELYQTDLLLQASAWDGDGFTDEQVALLRQNILGQKPLTDAQNAYKTVRATAVKSIADNTPSDDDPVPASPRLQNALDGQASLLDSLDLRLGILEAEQGDVAAAETRWQQVKNRHSPDDLLWRTADTLVSLWSDQSLPNDSESVIQESLQGWFRTRALEEFYERTAATDQLAQLQQTEVDRQNVSCSPWPRWVHCLP